MRAPDSSEPGPYLFKFYFLLRRWWRVLRSILRCFFFDILLRRFLTTEPIGPLPPTAIRSAGRAVAPCQHGFQQPYFTTSNRRA